MFDLFCKKILDRAILESDYIRYTPQSILSTKRENEQFFFDLPREDSVTSLRDSCLELDIEVKLDADCDARCNQ